MIFIEGYLTGKELPDKRRDRKEDYDGKRWTNQMDVS